MEEQLAELRSKLVEAEARATEERRLREEEQRKSQQAETRAADEQLRRKAAEADAQHSEPTNSSSISKLVTASLLQSKLSPTLP
jgi:hypothetical protein